MSNKTDSSANTMQYTQVAPPNVQYTQVAPPNVQYTPGAPPNVQYTPVAPPNYNAPPAVPQQSGVTPNQAYQMNIQQQQPPGSVVMGNQVVMVVENPRNARYPCRVECPYCKEQVTTKTEKDPSTLAYLLCCCTCICCFLCIDCLMNVQHICPKCNRKIATCKK